MSYAFVSLDGVGGAFAARLAAAELRRYWHARTGRVLSEGGPDERGGAIRLVGAGAADGYAAELGAQARALGPGAAVLRTVARGPHRDLWIAGSDDAGLLYGAYRVCERWGVYFHLHGDSLPDAPLAEAPEINEDRVPLFATRGLHPFHNFPEGPDGWSTEAYRLHLAQMAKMGLNFIGFHAYTDLKRPFEPQVWVGLPEDVGPDGSVAAGYAVENWHPQCGHWGYTPMDPANLPLEAGRLAPPDTFEGLVDAADALALFRRIGERWADAFAFARRRGVRTCLGLEVPLHLPAALAERIRAQGRDPGDPSVREEVFRGIFTRIARTHPLDMFWLYIPESWVWAQSIPEAEVDAVIREVELACSALAACKAPFELGVAGWVIGPRNDPLALERRLPPGIPLAALSAQVGHLPVSPHYARVRRRPGWAVPWMEDDPRLTVPQLWAGRTLRDAADAHALGCDGLLGIHWRTRGLAPQIAALARGAWDQRAWNPDFGKRFTEREIEDSMAGEGQVGGRSKACPPPPDGSAPGLPPALFESASAGCAYYRVTVPPGTYRVRCFLMETDARIAPGARRMSVAVNGLVVLDKADLVECYGHNQVAALEAPAIRVGEDRTIEIFLRQIIGETFLNAVEVAGHTDAFNQFDGVPFLRRINCGGPKIPDPAGDWEEGLVMRGGHQSRPRALDSRAVYDAWAQAEFGPAAGSAAAELFARMDGELPCITFMRAGPGNCTPDASRWADVAEQYRFVDEFAALRDLPMGEAERDRFHYWLHHLSYFRAAARLRCAAARPEDRDELEQAWRAVYTHLLEAVRSPGDLGTIFSVEQQWRMNNLKAAALPLPGPFAGTPRIVAPVLPSNIPAGAAFRLRAHVIGLPPPDTLRLQVRALEAAEWTEHPMPRLDVATYACDIPAGQLPPVFVYRIAPPPGVALSAVPAGTPAGGATCVVEPPV